MKIFPAKKSLPLVVTLSLLLGMGLLFWFGIIPFEHFVIEKADAIQQLTVLRQNRERQIDKLPELQAQFENIRANEDTLGVLLNEGHIIDFIKTLETLAGNAGVEVTIQSKDGTVIQEKSVSKVLPKKTEPASGERSKKDDKATSIVDTLPYDRYLRLNIVVRGSYGNIVNFLHKMETLPYALDVVGVSMKDRGDIVSTPSTPGSGRNPFLITPGGTSISVSPDKPADQSATEGALVVPPVIGNLEASFDTAVYLEK